MITKNIFFVSFQLIFKYQQQQKETNKNKSSTKEYNSHFSSTSTVSRCKLIDYINIDVQKEVLLRNNSQNQRKSNRLN